jgi:hypothetical protein
MPADASDPAFFSALLTGCKSAINEIVKGRSNEAAQRLALKRLLDSLGYLPQPDMYGTMDDLRSDVRLNLVLDTNVAITHCYRQWQEGNAAADAFPADELFRVGRRKVSRDWHRIWDEARSTLPSTSALESSSGRLAALKNDPIWTAISDFGLPWPPFKFGSGMGVRDIDFDTAVDLGLVQDVKREHEGTLEEAIVALLTTDEATLTTPPPQIAPDFERILILTLGEIDPASLPPSWN